MKSKWYICDKTMNRFNTYQIAFSKYIHKEEFEDTNEEVQKDKQRSTNIHIKQIE